MRRRTAKALGKHAAGCKGDGRWCPVGHVWRNRFGNASTRYGNNYIWLVFDCNDPTCEAQALVCSASVEQLIRKEGIR